MTKRMFTGDLEPTLRLELADDSGADLNATTATSIRIIGKRTNGTTVFDRAPTSTVHTGLVTVLTMAWVAGDTAVPGRLLIEVEVNWPGARKQTFPTVAVDVARDFDYVPTP